MKCLRILPEICARTFRCPGSSTRNIVPGNTCVTVPSVTICSSFGIAPRYAQPFTTQHFENTLEAVKRIRDFGAAAQPSQLPLRSNWRASSTLTSFIATAGLDQSGVECKTRVYQSLSRCFALQCDGCLSLAPV